MRGEPGVFGNTVGEIWTATRPSYDASFGGPTLLFTSPNYGYYSPSVSSDGLSLYLQGTELSRSDANVYLSRRESTSQPWGELKPVPELNDPNHWPSINSPWSTPVNLGDAINSADEEDMGMLTVEGGTFYFDRFDGTAADDATYYNSSDIWQSTVVPIETVGIPGAGGGYSQEFNGLGAVSTRGTLLPFGLDFYRQ
jgi:hypothetical protein